MDHLLVLSMYGAGVCVAVLFTKPGRSTKYFTFFLGLFLFRILIAQVIYHNNLAAISEIRLYSIYDSAGNYNDTLDMLDYNNGAFIPELPASAADPGYNTLLYWIGTVYKWAFNIVTPDYVLFLYSNVFFATLLFVAITHYLGKWHLLTSRTIAGAGMLLAVAEPNLLAFGSVLEREVVVGLIALLTFASFMEGRWLRFAIGSIVLFVFRSAYGYVIPVIVLAWVAFVSVPWFRKHLTLFLCLLLLVFGTAVQVMTTANSDIEYLLFRHIINDFNDLGGFGGYIQALSPGPRVMANGILGFVFPVPAYPLLDARFQGFYFFGLLVGLGSIFYLACNLVVLGALTRLRDAAYAEGVEPSERAAAQLQFHWVARGSIAVFVSHLVYQGLILNVRHKVQIVPFLILLTLYSLQFLKIRAGALGLLRLRQAAWSVGVIIGLNLVWLAAKIVVGRGAL